MWVHIIICFRATVCVCQWERVVQSKKGGPSGEGDEISSNNIKGIKLFPEGNVRKVTGVTVTSHIPAETLATTWIEDCCFFSSFCVFEKRKRKTWVKNGLRSSMWENLWIMVNEIRNGQSSYWTITVLSSSSFDFCSSELTTDFGPFSLTLLMLSARNPPTSFHLLTSTTSVVTCLGCIKLVWRPPPSIWSISPQDEDELQAQSGQSVAGWPHVWWNSCAVAQGAYGHFRFRVLLEFNMVSTAGSKWNTSPLRVTSGRSFHTQIFMYTISAKCRLMINHRFSWDCITTGLI